jgi:uncharacterized membrane protein YeaQ/YmgE (transglycosylase-associated protein family)
MDARTRQIVVTIVIGLVAGWLASLVVGGGGLLRYIITGIIGAFVGTFVLGALGIRLRLGNTVLEQIVTAAVGAIIVVILARILA